MATPSRRVSPRSAPGLADRTITISGVSKTYAMTGWRIGWAVAAEPVAKFMGDLQSQETSNPCSVSQWAALEAIAGPQDSVVAMKAEFQKRRDFVLSRIARSPNVTCLPPDGAFYAFMNVSAHFGRTLGGKRHRQFDELLHGRTEPSERGAGDGLGVWRRRLCAAVVCHQPANAREGLRRSRAISAVTRWSSRPACNDSDELPTSHPSEIRPCSLWRLGISCSLPSP